MNTTDHTAAHTASGPADRLRDALSQDSSSGRLQAALTAGSRPDPRLVAPLVERCAVEPDFFVRDMLTWALLRHRADDTVPRLLAEACSQVPQARSQALHTLSKIGDPRGRAAITPDVLCDPDDVVAATAWRAAVALVPADEAPALALALAPNLGRGDRDLQLSLSRALAALGDAAEAALGAADAHADERTRAHAHATRRLIEDPDLAFDAAVADAKRHVALAASPL